VDTYGLWLAVAVGSGLRGHVTGDERQHLPPLLVDPERKRRAGEPGVVQVGQVRLHGQAERPQRPPHRVPDPYDPLGDAIPGQQLAFAHTAGA
jgi:hypothetical protein